MPSQFWEILLLIVPSLLKIFIWNIDTRSKAEQSFRDWVKNQQSKAPLYIEEKESYDQQVEELNKIKEPPNVQSP